MSYLVRTEDLGQGYSIETLEAETGNTYYRICTGGTCRYAEDYWTVIMYAESMGWLPPNRQPIEQSTSE